MIVRLKCIHQELGPHRYFTRHELQDMFRLDTPHFSRTHEQLEKMHAKQRKTDSQLEEHIDFLKSLSECVKNFLHNIDDVKCI